MKNRHLFAMLVLAITCSMGFTACTQKEEAPDQVVVETPEEETKEDPEAEKKEETAEKEEEKKEETDAAAAQVTTYTSKDKLISATLPNAVWSNKMDTENVYSFASAKAGSVLIEHGAGQEAMDSRMIPNTTDLAVAMEQAGGLENGKDFEVRNYAVTEEPTHHVIDYAVVMLNADTREYAFKLVRVLYNDGEYFVMTGIVKEEDPTQLAEVTYVMDHVQAVGEGCTIKIPLPKEEPAAEETPADPAAETQAAATPAPAANGGITPYRDNPDNTDNTKTRTIYRNKDGHPLVISINSNGEWVDENGNKYRFTNECDVYDQNDVDYYYHGEAADVYYMPVG